jgi:hypothetical protein
MGNQEIRIDKQRTAGVHGLSLDAHAIVQQLVHEVRVVGHKGLELLALDRQPGDLLALNRDLLHLTARDVPHEVGVCKLRRQFGTAHPQE